MACKNRANLVSKHLSDAQIERAERAAAHADEIGRSFTHQLVIDWERTDYGSKKVQDVHALFLTRVRRWLERRKVPLVCLWSTEHDKFGRGFHIHTLIHVPRHVAKAFAEMLPRWTATETIDVNRARWSKRGKPKNTVVCGGVPQDHGSPIWVLQRRYDDSPQLLRYVLKSERLQPRHHGRVIGKRVGYSHAISPSAWKRLSGADDASAAV